MSDLFQELVSTHTITYRVASQLKMSSGNSVFVYSLIWVNKIFENIEKKIYEIFGPKYSIVRPICLNDGPLLLKDRPNYLKHRPNYYKSSPQIPTEMAPFTARGLTAQ